MRISNIIKKHLHHLALLSLFLLLSACTGGTEIGNPQIGTSNTFSSNAEMELYLKQQYASNIIISSPFPEDLTASPNGSGPTPDANDAINQQNPEYSQTNVQEAGVDESDQVKTDGQFLYVAGGNSVSIVRATPRDAMNRVSTIAVNGTVDSLYLYKKNLVILYVPEGSLWNISSDITGIAVGTPYWLSNNAKTGILIMDVTDPAHPARVRELRVDGSLVSSRRIDGKLHLVSQFLPRLPTLTWTYDGTEEDRMRVIAANMRALEPYTLTDLIPSCDVIGDNGAVISRAPLIRLDRFFRPANPVGATIVTISTFNLEDPLVPFNGVGIVADAHTVYASTKALYLVTHKYESNALLSVIHKFDLTAEKVAFAARGEVMGYILNQFSLGEHDDILRVATTSWTSSQPVNGVACLKTENGKLTVIGQIDNITPGERIYAARFTGARGFLVTFRQTDPLITLDLSDPTKPRIAGELIVDGFSTYIHLLDDRHLLTIGLDNGLTLSIFNVSDFSHPALTHRVSVGGASSSSEALYNHKAFTFWAYKGLLAIPVYDQPGVHSLHVYRVDAVSGIEFLGKIDDMSPCAFWWMRGVFIGESVYAVKNDFVKSAAITGIAGTVSTLALP